MNTAYDIQYHQERFGLCPLCGEFSGSVMLNGAIWSACDQHRVKWRVDDRFRERATDWVDDQTANKRRRRYADIPLSVACGHSAPEGVPFCVRDAILTVAAFVLRAEADFYREPRLQTPVSEEACRLVSWANGTDPRQHPHLLAYLLGKRVEELNLAGVKCDER